jgi:hypothetical protein
MEKLEPINEKGIDLYEYEGKKVPIDILEVIEAKSNWDENGQFIAGLNRQVLLLRVATKPLFTIETEDGEKTDIRASELINLKYSTDSGNWGYSTSPKSKIQRLLKRCKKNKPEELKGAFVTLRVRVRENSDGTEHEFLGFICD